ncbi:MAG: SIR2 family protein [Tissierellales bacterium]|nr:SIR2 family protein [Tissierellales bacterium]
MNYDTMVKFVQQHFTDGLALVIGSGLSAAEGIPGMPALAAYLINSSKKLTGNDLKLWAQIQSVLDTDEGLESALLKYPPSETLEVWIAQKICELLIPKERDVIGEVMRGDRSLRLTTFLSKVLKPTNGLPILTPNYDRLIEVACEIAGFHVDTTAIGHYAGAFDHTRSCMGSCRGITTRAKHTVLDHFPRAIVLKPHGSFDWYLYGKDARRCALDLDAERLIITPGLNKYQAGYSSPFDKHRDLANDYIKQAGRLLIVGYGFNDDHLQTHLLKKIQDGTPTLILNRTISEMINKLANESPRCVCLSKPKSSPGVVLVTNGTTAEFPGNELWDLKILSEELLS